MIRPHLWNRRYSWPEWRRMHSNLNERDAQILFEQELRMYDMYEQDLINLKENRIADYVQRLGEYQTNMTHGLMYGGVTPPGYLGQATGEQSFNGVSVTQTFNTPGTHNIINPIASRAYNPFTSVTIEAVGGGGGGNSGARTYSNALYVGGGGGAGAYVKRTVPITSDTKISVTVGEGGQAHYQEPGSNGLNPTDGGDSSFTIGGVTTTAGGGATPRRDFTNYGEWFTNPTPPLSQFHTGSNGTVTGPYDEAILGSGGTNGAGLIFGQIPDPGLFPSGLNPLGTYIQVRQSGKGNKSGWPGSRTADPAQMAFEGGALRSYTQRTLGPPSWGTFSAQPASTPGGGGGGGGVTVSVYDYYPSNGADGRVVVTFGYS